MHPAPSVILFTTFSGLGFGLLFWLGIGMPGPTGWLAFTFFAIAYLMAVGGLFASTFHLGHPERAIKAFSQWKTSWLSREAWLSVLALTMTGLYALAAIFLDTRIAPLGWLASLLSLGTVLSTSMIYAQMKTVPRWRHWSTSALFLLLSLGGGALLAAQTTAALVLLALAGVVQAVNWWQGDGAFAAAGSTMETATGLGRIGRVRLFEAPHTGGNYLLDEMVCRVGRKHRTRLRIIALLGLSILPVLMLLLPMGHLWALVAVLIHLTGVFASRWLFFAEAEHVVGLYYGRR